MATALPSKELSVYGVTELKRFVYETGRTYGTIQYDKENALQSFVKSVVREVGCLSARSVPKGSSASQGAVERFHETLDGAKDELYDYMSK